MSEGKKKMKLLFIPGEVPDEEILSTTGLARKMIEKGHRVKFIVCEHSKRLEQLGLDYDILTKQEEVTSTSAQVQPVSSEVNTKPGLFANWINFGKTFMNYIKTEFINMEEKNGQLEKIIARYNPDMFITDDFFEYFSTTKTDKPWVWLFNGNPLRILSDENLPPPYSGLPSDKPTLMWVLNRLFYNLFVRFMRAVFNLGLSAFGKPFRLITDGSPYLNLFSYPKELDYENRKQWKQNYYRVDSFLLKDTKYKTELKIPTEKLKDKQTRVVFVSMGTTHSTNSFFMNKLLQILSKSPHLYLISKKDSPEEYKLSENMWSDGVASTIQMLEKSELFITDGSNGSVTDAFTLGKPMIVIPMWMAQLDNAQRIQETGYGIRLNAWSFTEEQLLGAIDKLLNDQDLKTRLNKASNRIWEENRLDKAAELIENLGHDKWFFKHN